MAEEFVRKINTLQLVFPWIEYDVATQTVGCAICQASASNIKWAKCSITSLKKDHYSTHDKSRTHVNASLLHGGLLQQGLPSLAARKQMADKRLTLPSVNAVNGSTPGSAPGSTILSGRPIPVPSRPPLVPNRKSLPVLPRQNKKKRPALKRDEVYDSWQAYSFALSYFAVKHELPASVQEPLCRLFLQLNMKFQENVKGCDCEEVACAEFNQAAIISIGNLEKKSSLTEVAKFTSAHVLSETIKGLKQAGSFSILIGLSNEGTALDEVTKDKHLTLQVRYLNKKSQVEVRFIELLNVEHGDSLTITCAILNRLIDKGIDFTKCVGLGTDGSSVMSDLVEGVCISLKKIQHALVEDKEKFMESVASEHKKINMDREKLDSVFRDSQQQVPPDVSKSILLGAHCAPQKLALAFQESNSDVEFSYMKLVQEVIAFFNTDSSRALALEIRCKDLGIPPKKLPEFDQSKWLSFGECCKLLSKKYVAVVSVIKDSMEMTTSSTGDSDDYVNELNAHEKNGLYNRLLSLGFRFWLAFMADIINNVNFLCDFLQCSFLQTRDLLAVDVLPQMVTCKQHILDSYCAKALDQPKSLYLKSFMQETEVVNTVNADPGFLNSIKEHCRIYAEKVLCNLSLRFDDDSSRVLTLFYCLLPKYMLSDPDLESFLQLKKYYDFLFPDVEAAVADEQYQAYYERARFSVQMSNREFLFKALNDATFQKTIPVILILLKVLATLVYSNVDCERSFSTMTKVQAFEKQRQNDSGTKLAFSPTPTTAVLTIENMSDCLRVAQDGQTTSLGSYEEPYKRHKRWCESQEPLMFSS